LSRHDGKFTADGAAQVGRSELEKLLGARASSDLSRSAAIAAFLSAEGGWEAAGKSLRGAFNDSAADPSWLTPDKEA